nr:MULTISPECIES: TolC family protein [Myxococcaceae]
MAQAPAPPAASAPTSAPAPTPAPAAAAPAAPAPPTAAHARPAQALDLPALIERAQRGARVEMVRSQVQSMQAKQDEVARVTLPQGELTVLGAPSPRINCIPSVDDCITTDPREPGVHFQGALVRIDLRAVWPIYTFGKREGGLRAAKAGVAATQALVEAGTADASVDAARAYYGVKLGRELVSMLEEGQDILRQAVKRTEEELAQPDTELGEGDRRRLRVLQTEAAGRLAEARKLEAVALAGVRFLAGDDKVDVDEKPLEALPGRLPQLAHAESESSGRPDVRAAQYAAKAAEGLSDVERARLLPDLAVVAQGAFARAAGAENPHNAYFADPFNTTSVGAGLALRWTIDPATRLARLRGAEADAARARTGAGLAASAAQLAARAAWADAQDALGRREAAIAGEAEARAWLVSSLQAEAAGLVDTKDIGDSLTAWFGQRARLAQATFDWDIAVFTLMRAMGAPYTEAYALPK